MPSPAPLLAYVGCRTTKERNAQGRGLAVYECAAEGPWRQVQRVEGLRNPSYICAHPTEAVLYAVHGDFGEISTFKIRQDGSLEKLAEQSTCGVNPVHLAVSSSSQWLVVANYATGSVASMRIGEAGQLGAVAYVLKLTGECGPHPQQEGSHPHQICLSPDGRYILVPDKGLDTVFALELIESTGMLKVVSSTSMRRGSGPRHMAFHPTLPLAYLVGELNRTISTVRYDAGNGFLQPVSERSTVPRGVESGSAAGVVFAQDGSRLYVSNRGHDSVAAFPVCDDGTLGSPSWIDAGKTPRFICQLPNGGPLLVAREDGHSLATLEPNAHFNDVAQTGSPVCVVFRKANP